MHKDIRIDNILLPSHFAFEEIKVVDFGSRLLYFLKVRFSLNVLRTLLTWPLRLWKKLGIRKTSIFGVHECFCTFSSFAHLYSLYEKEAVICCFSGYSPTSSNFISVDTLTHRTKNCEISLCSKGSVIVHFSLSR